MTLRLDGQLVCADSAEAALVERELPRHRELSRAEPGCLRFEVSPTDDPLVWLVHEEFRDRTCFDAHQRRVAGSEWGEATRGIERRYSIVEEPPDCE